MVNLLRNRQGRLRNGWWILAFYLILATLVVPATIYASSEHVVVSPAVQAVLVAVATALCLMARRERCSSVIGTAATWKDGVPAGLASGVIIWGNAATAVWATGAVRWSWADGSLVTLVDGALACLAVAVVEELVFRGFAFQRLVDGIGAWPAQVLMGGYFVLTHAAGISTAGELKWLAVANIFIASLVFGAAYLRTRSLAMPIALHFALNFVQGPLLGFGVSGTGSKGLLRPELAPGSTWWTGGAFGLEASIPGTAAIAVALVLLVMWRQPLTNTRTTHAVPGP